MAYVPKEELLAIEGFDEEIVEELRSRANNSLLTQALTANDKVHHGLDLITMQGMTPELVEQMTTIGVTNLDELAESSVDELMALAFMTEEQAGKLIMKARERWFTEDDTEQQ